MGTGKTETGRRAAAALGREFVDMDQVIEARERRSISQIFSEEGEAYFRRLERALVQELSARQNLVIAAGGGVVLNPANIEDFSRTGVVICLRATPEAILRRVACATHRPLLEQSGAKERRIRELLEARRPFYEAIRLQVDTTDRSPDEVAAEVLRLFRNA